MNLSKYICPNCRRSELRIQSRVWKCEHCGKEYTTVNGIPRLYVESELGKKDKELRDKFYNGFLGTYYQHVMPFLSLPARPALMSWKEWLFYTVFVLVVLSLVAYLMSSILVLGFGSIAQIIVALILIAIGFFLFKHPYLFYLLLLAVPVKLSLLLNRFRPSKSFPEVHADALRELSNRGDRLQLLDISTGTCNSLYRHGWMNLDADYTGLDLSETMLLQGQKLMAERQIPVELVLGDATRLPFANDTFDIVLNYGALNGFTNPKLALEEMARVARPRALVLFLDEQLYERASSVERLYFRKVLSSHNVIHRCPVDLIPASLSDITVHQVYHFYYICTCYKPQIHAG
ncbi:MAG TPA: methyltransferase domain-containing protein [Pyrinomonadaceae bacterium]|nr:methyltransferase domain-containing protein [Pyrinomonadaceae bacterium]